MNYLLLPLVFLALLLEGAFGACSAAGRGDPAYTGFNGKKFLFKGHEGGIYSVFSDPWININTLYGPARENGGTVMVSYGIMIDNHNISFGINGSRLSSWEVEIDGVSKTLGKEFSLIQTGCVSLEWNRHQHLTLRTPVHQFDFQYKHEVNQDITYPRVDFAMQHLEENPHDMGGLVGQTALEEAHISVMEADFETKGLFKLHEGSHFKSRIFDCKEETPKRDARYIVLDEEGNCMEYENAKTQCNGKQDYYDPHAYYYECDSGICAITTNGDLVCIQSGQIRCDVTCTTDDDCPRMQVCVAQEGQDFDDCPQNFCSDYYSL